MKKSLHIFATLFCLLTLLVSSASCVTLAKPLQSACDQCPKQSPDNHQLPTCCSAHGQPSAVATVQKSSAHLELVSLPSVPEEIVYSPSTLVPPRVAPSPPLLLTPLRI
ncbi:hypothetical protein [Granulicella sp. S190]|uniref:hypothetical protein n=1 Tax=Granulicella sp. S190 TaxID=1747226 RepID=UPI00131E383F|nr:hypothetical protein [Granulicella sp. S190]